MEMQLRSFQKSQDYGGQRQLFALSFPETVNTEISSDLHYSWKFETLPSWQYVAQDEAVIGYYAAIKYQYKIGPSFVSCGMVCDVMTHPERRGKGIFTKLGHFSTNALAEEKVAFTSGYPIRPEVIPGHLKVGWKIVLSLPVYVRIVSLKKLVPSILWPLSFLGDAFLKGIYFSFDLFRSKSYICEIFKQNDFLKLNDYEMFLKAWLMQQTNALIKDRSFLQWRTGAPQTEYLFLILRKKEKMVGMAIVREVVLKGIATLAILDIMILQEEWRGAGALHHKILRCARDRQLSLIAGMTSARWAWRYSFFRNFFIRTPAVFSLIVKELNKFPGSENLFRPEAWHLFWLDSDDL